MLAWNWVESVRPDLKLIVTRRMNPTVTNARIAADVGVPTLFYPDLTRLRVPRRAQTLKSFVETALFLLWLPRIATRIRASGARRLFAFFGGGTWFLFITGWAARWTGLPFDVYLVDDLEESARQSRQPWLASLTRRVEPRILRRADRVFTISPGYVEHLWAKYRVRAEWLPVAIPRLDVGHRPYRPEQPDIRTITFIGAVNALYLDALKDALQVIEQWNAAGNPFRIRLSLLTYSNLGFLERELGRHGHLELRFRPSSQEFKQQLLNSWALFLPCSFAEEMRVMVSTSFPTKLVDMLPAGRPILVYGPPYASVLEYFAANKLPLCTHSPAQFKAVLRQIESTDTAALIEQYAAVIQRLHSRESIRTTLERIEPTASRA